MIFANAITTMASSVMIMNGQFDMLFCSLKNIRATAMTLNGRRLKELKLDKNVILNILQNVFHLLFSPLFLPAENFSQKLI